MPPQTGPSVTDASRSGVRTFLPFVSVLQMAASHHFTEPINPVTLEDREEELDGKN